MKKLVLAAATAALLGTAATTTADAGAGCPKWICGENGTQLNGIGKNGMRFNGWRTNGHELQGVQVNGLQQPIGSARPVVNAVILPSGETIDLR